MIGYRFKSLDGFNCEVIDHSGWLVLFKSDCGKSGIGIDLRAKEGNAHILFNNFTYFKADTIKEYKKLKESKAWRIYMSMMGRVFSGVHPSYKNVSISEEWGCFNNFKKWHDENCVYGYVLDKDLFSKSDNKIYSPDTCCFIPKTINGLIKADPNKIMRHKKSFAYYYTSGKGREYLSFKSEEEAIESKRQYYSKLIKGEAEKFRTKLDKRVYEKLISLYEK